jgi:hypothetical protein
VNITLLSSMSTEGMGPSLAVESSTTHEVFEAYVEHVLAPSLKPGQVVVMDNLSSHKGGRISELIEERGCELLYLPPYSPDLKWDEKAETEAPCGSYDGVMSVRSPRKEGHDHPAQRHRRHRSR